MKYFRNFNYPRNLPLTWDSTYQDHWYSSAFLSTRWSINIVRETTTERLFCVLFSVTKYLAACDACLLAIALYSGRCLWERDDDEERREEKCGICALEPDAKSRYQKNGREAFFRFIFCNLPPSDSHASAATDEIAVTPFPTLAVHKAQTALLFA